LCVNDILLVSVSTGSCFAGGAPAVLRIISHE
jgi:hypothetical protein